MARQLLPILVSFFSRMCHCQSISEIAVAVPYIKEAIKLAEFENSEHFCTIFHNNLSNYEIHYLVSFTRRVTDHPLH